MIFVAGEIYIYAIWRAPGPLIVNTSSQLHNDIHYKTEMVVAPSEVYNGDTYNPKPSFSEYRLWLGIYEYMLFCHTE